MHTVGSDYVLQSARKGTVAYYAYHFLPAQPTHAPTALGLFRIVL